MEGNIAPQADRGVRQWGGLAGVLGAVLVFSTFGIVGALVVPVAATPEELVARFPDIRAARTIENGLYLAAMVLWVMHVTALGQAVRARRPAAALFGQAVSTFGLVALAAGALPHLAAIPLSDLYRAPGVTAEQQAALVMQFQVTQGVFDALLVTGLLVLPAGLVSLGVAMRAAPAYGAGYGGLTIGLGAIAFASGVASLIEVSAVVVVGFFTLMAFHTVIGWKTFRTSREPAAALAPAGAHQPGMTA
jgi:hypothetical protein